MENPGTEHRAGPARRACPSIELLPLRAVVVTLAFTQAAAPRIFHQPAVTAFVRTLLGGPADYDIRLTVDCPETGRIGYRAGDRYRFTLLALAGGEELLDRALAALVRLPQSFPLRDPGFRSGTTSRSSRRAISSVAGRSGRRGISASMTRRPSPARRGSGQGQRGRGCASSRRRGCSSTRTSGAPGAARRATAATGAISRWVFSCADSTTASPISCGVAGSCPRRAGGPGAAAARGPSLLGRCQLPRCGGPRAGHGRPHGPPGVACRSAAERRGVAVASSLASTPGSASGAPSASAATGSRPGSRGLDVRPCRAGHEPARARLRAVQSPPRLTRRSRTTAEPARPVVKVRRAVRTERNGSENPGRPGRLPA